MLTIADKSTTMPSGWHCLADCGLYDAAPLLIRAGTFNDLVISVMNYRIANMLPVEDVRREVEEWICRNTKARCRVLSPPANAVREITVSDVWRWLKTMAAWTKNLTLVSQEEADARAEKCAGCTKQADAVGCWGCSQLSEKVFSLIGFRRTRFDAQLKSCSVCGCNNASQAWVPLDVLKKASGNLEYPEQINGEGSPPCWKR